MADEYISRNAAIERLEEKKSLIRPTEFEYNQRYLDICDAIDFAIDTVKNIQSADVVTRDCYDRILWENDIMRKQLVDIGKSFGEKMDDVQKVVHGRWIDSCDAGVPSSCNICKYQVSKFSKSDFCPCCGSDMRPIENK